MKDAVLKSTTMSDIVLPRVAGAVESLDSMACDRLDHLKAAVPAIAEPMPQLLQTTKKAASGYWSKAVDYLSSFTVSQVSLSMADRSLDAAAKVVAVVGRVEGTPAAAGGEAAKRKASLFGRLYETIG